MLRGDPCHQVAGFKDENEFERRTSKTVNLIIDVRSGSEADISLGPTDVCFTPERWGNRPASLWIAGRFWVLRFRLMVKRGPCVRPQASEGEAQHGPFCWTGRIGQGDQRLHCG